jgi:hypothetical protein
MRLRTRLLWAGLVALLVGGGAGVLILRLSVLNPSGHDWPPPNWGNPPLYPGAQQVQSGISGAALPLPRSDMYFSPSKTITYSAPARPDVVIEWYRQRFTAEGWTYRESSVVGLDSRETSKDFWKYNWYTTESFIPTYSMDIEAQLANGENSFVTIRLGRFFDHHPGGTK